MKQIYAFESIPDYENYKDEIDLLNKKLKTYKELLINQFELIELPKSIVWTSSKNAITVFSQVPVPAYTNRETIYMSPSVSEWKAFYLSQLDGEELEHNDEIQYINNYFQSLTIDDVFCILAHELTHHIELFPDEFEEERHNSIWFEEGMCEYLSQRMTLTEHRYTELRKIKNLMIKIFKPKYGDFSLDDFGIGSYNQTSLASIMLNYWRSTAAIHFLVECRNEGDVKKVFSKYEEWHEKGRQQPLTEYFGVEKF
ncbi:hypothetical protein JOC25_002365 [Solibacillus kalamii]|nr:hypothetical protein [Solibacillus kalamii]MBM7665872.1 hypothetical protein [Solibacillus kalamii]